MEFASTNKKRKAEENGDAATDSPPPPQDDGAPAPLSPDDIRKILQPLSPDQLVDLLQSASLRHPAVLDSVRAVADRDSTARKLFVRGLAGETTSETLRGVFTVYGELDEAIVIFDKATGRSKGYGFVVFRHVDGAILALKDPSKKIDGRMTVTQLAAAGGPGGGGSGDVSLRKVFVGNVPFELSSERLLDEFLKFGEVEEGPLGFDKSSGKTKGFAFFVYKTEEGARASLVPVAPAAGYGHGYGNAQMGGQVSGDYGARVPPNTGGGFPDGSQYGFPLPSALQPQPQPQQQPLPMARPPPAGISTAADNLNCGGAGVFTLACILTNAKLHNLNTSTPPPCIFSYPPPRISHLSRMNTLLSSSLGRPGAYKLNENGYTYKMYSND
ncbi:hypothetical protein Fmac_006187 [Flemingia macrophylla]|uniref:RRM domain-containing protein n=1 Tax=Flemingia macrophylla TaxID=520843 RepID=A0ABD1N9W3_9FABA